LQVPSVTSEQLLGETLKSAEFAPLNAMELLA
jgi:hypothetical protein